MHKHCRNDDEHERTIIVEFCPATKKKLPLSTSSAATRGVTMRTFFLPLLPLPLHPRGEMPRQACHASHSASETGRSARNLRRISSISFLSFFTSAAWRRDVTVLWSTASASVREHWRGEERPRGSHVPVRDCTLLRPGHLRKRRRPRPGEVASVPVGRLASRGPLPRWGTSTRGGPSPAPWQPSFGRDGDMPGAGDPAALRRLQRVHHPWRPLRFTNGRHKRKATTVQGPKSLPLIPAVKTNSWNLSLRQHSDVHLQAVSTVWTATPVDRHAHNRVHKLHLWRLHGPADDEVNTARKHRNQHTSNSHATAETTTSVAIPTMKPTNRGLPQTKGTQAQQGHWPPCPEHV